MRKILITLMVAMCGSIAAIAADKPQYPGGEEAMQKFITDNLNYPTAAADNGIEGNVNLEFIVKADGSISSIKVVRMIDPYLEEEAIRLVRKMPAWEPAISNGAAVDMPVKITIPFRL